MDEPDYIKELKEQYRSTIEEKLSELNSLVQIYSTNRNEETLESFRMAIHKLAGSAGSVGFMEVSDLCKKMENRILQGNRHFFDRLLFFRLFLRSGRFTWRRFWSYLFFFPGIERERLE